MKEKTKRSIWWVLGLALMLSLLSGCVVPFSRMPQFTDEEEAALVERGRKIVEQAIPETAVITKIHRQASNNAVGVLGNRVAGEYVTEDGITWWFEVNTDTEELESGILNDPSAPKPPEIKREWVDVSTEDMKAIGLRVVMDTLSVSNDGYEALSKGLEQLNERMEETLLIQAEAFIPEAKEKWEATHESDYHPLNCQAYINQADTKLVSISYYMINTRVPGGPVFYKEEFFLDAQTGEILEPENLPTSELDIE